MRRFGALRLAAAAAAVWQRRSPSLLLGWLCNAVHKQHSSWTWHGRACLVCWCRWRGEHAPLAAVPPFRMSRMSALRSSSATLLPPFSPS